ncbi:amidase [Pyruvatibacter mobilis]|uniref:Indoleacetamide hydrolase n=1 Tax=Pyruvatibacter mobilis TaxID=1712261 RepID=A0A845QEY8_9HYPH|nr:amidase [Pyruvatibacter mobilis]NBG97102.1 amidase [Pyruvatibacter mobilis]QJD74380.1 amidase [Pyruvatibacter mobilis]GGD06480.1 6-aminohexanoate-cyclic-dimer hydrolase [Pyruvatibacter mobilis]
MSGFSEYDQYDALGLADLVRRKDVTPTELLDEAITRLERVDTTLNAVPLRHYDEARAQISRGLPDGPFTGVPFLLKDLHLLLTGTVTTYGSGAFTGNVADHNSTLTQRYLDAGMVIFGKTNSPEFGLAGTTEPRLYGPTRNPWNTEHSPGGSSGGAAAAVAAGVLPIANASDGGGSIRVPASACGLFGLKPTRARTPMGPDRGEGWGGMSISHAVSRSVRDNAALLDATCAPAPGDPYAAPAPARPYLDEVTTEPRRLRIALTATGPNGNSADTEVQAGLDATATLLRELGHEVIEAAPKVDPADMALAQISLIASNIALTLDMRSEALGRPVTENDVEHITWAIAQNGRGLTAADFARGTLTIHRLGRLVADFMTEQKADLLLSPTLALPPVKLGTVNMDSEDIAAYLDINARYMPFPGLFNMTGQPSMSVPLHWTEAGLPVGMMFTAPFGDEATLFQLAGQLERARPWGDRRPPVHAAG